MSDASPTAAPAAMPKTLVVGCGALARELLALVRAGGWGHVRVTCLPAKLHNRPERIPARLALAIRAGRAAGYERVVAAFADCGTGGAIDRVLAAEGVARIAGPHCYAFYAGQADFARLMEEEPGSFFLTDYLVRQFDALVVEGLGLTRHPRMRDWMFGGYRRLVWLAQSPDPALAVAAERAAGYLGLPLEVRRTGMGELAGFVEAAATGAELPVPGAGQESAAPAHPPAADDRPDDRPPRPRRANARRSAHRRPAARLAVVR